MADCEADYIIVTPPNRCENLRIYSRPTIFKNKANSEEETWTQSALTTAMERNSQTVQVDQDFSVSRSPSKVFKLGPTFQLTPPSNYERRRHQEKLRQDRGFREWKSEAKLGPNHDSPFDGKEKPKSFKAISFDSPSGIKDESKGFKAMQSPFRRSILDNWQSQEIIQRATADTQWMRQRSRPTSTNCATTPPGRKITNGRKVLLYHVERIRKEERDRMAKGEMPSTPDKYFSPESDANNNLFFKQPIRSQSEERDDIRMQLDILTARLEQLKTRASKLVKT